MSPEPLMSREVAAVVWLVVATALVTFVTLRWSDRYEQNLGIALAMLWPIVGFVAAVVGFLALPIMVGRHLAWAIQRFRSDKTPTINRPGERITGGGQRHATGQSCDHDSG